MLILTVIQSTVNALLEDYADAIEKWSGSCEQCGTSLQRAGTYIRLTPWFLGPFCVQLVGCPNDDCSVKKQALLPSWLHPYQQTLALDQEQALWDLAYGNRTVEAIAEACNVAPKTVQRWWSRFYDGLDILLQLVAAWLSTFDTFATWVRHPGHTPRERAQTAFGLLRKLHVWQEPPPGMGLLALVLQRQPCLFLPCRREAHA